MPASEATARDAELLFDAVREAGNLALTLFRQNVRRWPKQDGSQVSEADIQVNRLLERRLVGERPSFGWLSEETPDSDLRLACERLWIVDPIDGTRAFIDGRPDWCVAGALIDGGRPVAAAIYQPMGEVFYSAVLGGGATRNGLPIAADRGAFLRDSRIVGTKNSLKALLPHQIAPDVSGALPLLLRLAGVASGDFAATLSSGNKNDWDLAAGDLIVREAGGHVTSWAGAPLIYNRRETWQQGLVAAGPNRHEEIIGILRSA